MIPATNLQMRRGDTLPLNLAVTQNGSAFNLTSCSLRMTAKWNYSDLDAAAVFKLTNGSGITVTNAGAGLATATVAPANTSSLPPNTVQLYYDIQVTDASSNVYTVAWGQLTVNPDVSITTP